MITKRDTADVPTNQHETQSGLVLVVASWNKGVK